MGTGTGCRFFAFMNPMTMPPTNAKTNHRHPQPPAPARIIIASRFDFRRRSSSVSGGSADI